MRLGIANVSVRMSRLGHMVRRLEQLRGLRELVDQPMLS